MTIQRERYSFSKIDEAMELPNLIETQLKSYQWFLEEGLNEVLEEISPIEDFSKKFTLELIDYYFDDPEYTPQECREGDLTYSADLQFTVRLINKETGEVKEQDVFMGDFPMMTDKGTFIVNGAERIIVNQLSRSAGVYFDEERTRDGRRLIDASIIPKRGTWLEFEYDKMRVISVRVDRSRKMPSTILFRALGYGTDEDLLELFDNHEVIQDTINKDNTESQNEALIALYKRLNPGQPPTLESAEELLESRLFNHKRYDLADVGRYKINEKLNLDIDPDKNVLDIKDIVETVKYILKLIDNHPDAQIDDIDHLGNRRLKTVGELVQNQFKIGLSRMERTIKERMTTKQSEVVTPRSLINSKPVISVIKKFFNSSQLSQFMDQTNPLSELTHKRRFSALGPGGLTRERAGFDVRDVHHTHYGRICPIETPEGPNIGLIGSMSTYSQTNEYGFLMTPYLKVKKGKVTDEIEYLNAFKEDRNIVAQANTPFDKEGNITTDQVIARYKRDILEVSPDEVDYIDVSPKQIVGVSAALIPFLENDDANRALMGANMQRQAVPLLKTEAPIVATGVEKKAAKDSGLAVISKSSGVVKRVTSKKITVETDEGKKENYNLLKFKGSNQGSCINQKPIVRKGDKIEAGDIIADGPAMDKGELSLGKNVLIAFMAWEGYNYEDAILISEKLVKEDAYTSIHIEEHEIKAQETKLGPEEITNDIPNVSESDLKNLDDEGIIRVGAEVGEGDILVGKITPKGEKELTAEERLLNAIFGEKAREVRDNSLRVPHGEKGVVVDVKVLSTENGDELDAGVNKLVKVHVATKRKLSVGDKLAGRHGNKGVVSRILPEQDMPFMEDGTPVEIVLNPLGVPSRMNIGQVLETHLGRAAKVLNMHVETPVFDGAQEDEIEELLKKAGIDIEGKETLYDGRTGLPFDNKITVGYMYILKLHHLVDKKIHARSTGPYSLVTQQPLGGKAQFGGQRFGEMEVWALEAYGAAYTLQEMLTIKSDDLKGRTDAYEAIVKGENIPEPNLPESFRVLIREMQSLGLDAQVFSDEKEVEIAHSINKAQETEKKLGVSE